MTKIRIFYVAFFLTCSGQLMAQPFEAEKFLLPVALRAQVPGAYGSLWETRLTLVNRGEEVLKVSGIDTQCVFPPCLPPTLLPDSTIHAIPLSPNETTPGYFLLVEKSRADQMAVQLRIQDVSRQAQTWGTELPVIRESQALTGETSLLDIPVDPLFRGLLRIYDFEPGTGRQILVRVFHTDPARQRPEQQVTDALIHETTLTLQPPRPVTNSPGYAQLALWNIPGVPASGRLRVEVAPLASGLKFWAFASVTNNETQHVTTITPQ